MYAARADIFACRILPWGKGINQTTNLGFLQNFDGIMPSVVLVLSQADATERACSNGLNACEVGQLTCVLYEAE